MIQLQSAWINLVPPPPEASATAKFCSMMDKFFDFLNVRNTTEHVLKRKPFLQPYSDVEDPRFTWLDQFLQYFSHWKDSIEKRKGNFSEMQGAVYSFLGKHMKVFKQVSFPSKKFANFSFKWCSLCFI